MTNLVKRLRDWPHIYPEDLYEPEGYLYEVAADRIEKLEAENKLLREAGQAVLDRFGTPPWKEAEDTGYAINRLRAALKKGEE